MYVLPFVSPPSLAKSHTFPHHHPTNTYLQGAPEDEDVNEDLEDEELDPSNVLDKRTRGQAGETTNYGEVEKKLKDDAEPSWGDDDEEDDDDFVDPDEEGEDKEMEG